MICDFVNVLFCPVVETSQCGVSTSGVVGQTRWSTPTGDFLSTHKGGEMPERQRGSLFSELPAELHLQVGAVVLRDEFESCADCLLAEVDGVGEFGV